MNPGPFIPIALVLGGLVAVAASWPFARSVRGALVAALLATPAVSFAVVLLLLFWFEGDPEEFFAAMGGQGLRLAGVTALLAVPCGAVVGLVVFGFRRLLRGKGALGGSASASAPR